MYIGFSETETFLRNCEDAVIITHRNPDGDCIGAGFGFGSYEELSEAGADYYVSDVPALARFLLSKA